MTCAFKLTRVCLFCRNNESNRLASSTQGLGLSQLLPEHSTPSSSEVPTSEPALQNLNAGILNTGIISFYIPTYIISIYKVRTHNSAA